MSAFHLAQFPLSLPRGACATVGLDGTVDLNAQCAGATALMRELDVSGVASRAARAKTAAASSFFTEPLFGALRRPALDRLRRGAAAAAAAVHSADTAPWSHCVGGCAPRAHPLGVLAAQCAASSLQSPLQPLPARAPQAGYLSPSWSQERYAQHAPRVSPLRSPERRSPPPWQQAWQQEQEQQWQPTSSTPVSRYRVEARRALLPCAPRQPPIATSEHAGFLFVCSNIAFRESLELNLFGLSKRCFVHTGMQKIGKSTLIFIAEQNSKRLYGTWRATAPAAIDIDRSAFAGRQPAQLRVELMRECGFREDKPHGETEALSMRWTKALRTGALSVETSSEYVAALAQHARKAF